MDELEALAKSAGAGGLLRLKHVDGKLRRSGGQVPRRRTRRRASRSRRAISRSSWPRRIACRAPRSIACARNVRAGWALVDPRRRMRFLWVTDFPMFDRDPATGALGAVHHPFTAPNADDMVALPDERPSGGARMAYDVVLQRHRTRRRQHSHQRPARAVAHVRAARHRRCDGAGAALRLPARGAARRRAAARRHRASASTASRCCWPALPRCAT